MTFIEMARSSRIERITAQQLIDSAPEAVAANSGDPETAAYDALVECGTWITTRPAGGYYVEAMA